tara:strand:+ start:5640 stop:7859 length:2220 start_codon:yes stop_codon:yes gene_type:complete
MPKVPKNKKPSWLGELPTISDFGSEIESTYAREASPKDIYEKELFKTIVNNKKIAETKDWKGGQAYQPEKVFAEAKEFENDAYTKKLQEEWDQQAYPYTAMGTIPNVGYPASGKADYVPVELMALPGTPAIKGLGKTGNFVLDALNPIGGMGKNPTGGFAKGNVPMSQQIDNLWTSLNPRTDGDVLLSQHPMAKGYDYTGTGTHPDMYPVPWSIDQPMYTKLQLGTTMSGGPLEKQIAKDGQINVNNIRSIANKGNTADSDKYIINKVLDEQFPGQKNIDYNDFRQAVSEELVPLQRGSTTGHARHGMKSLGYDVNNNFGYHNDGGVGRSASKVPPHFQYIKDNMNSDKAFPSHIGYDGLPKWRIEGWNTGKDFFSKKEAQDFAKKEIQRNEDAIVNGVISLESTTFGNPTRFGEGANKHFNNADDLGHTRSFVSNEEPDVFHVMEAQSDFYQASKADRPSIPDPQRTESYLKHSRSQHAMSTRTYENLKKKFDAGELDEQGYPIHNTQVEQARNTMLKYESQVQQVKNRQTSFENSTQKDLLEKNHQARLLQESVDQAVDAGKSKVRYPTSETAAKVEGYPEMDPEQLTIQLEHAKNSITYGDGTTELRHADGDLVVAYEKFDPPMYMKGAKNITAVEYNKIRQAAEDKIITAEKRANSPYPVYESEYATILNKYDKAPKMIKKTLGVEAKKVTDTKGNTWYEFDVPKNYKNKTAEIKALGVVGTGVLGVGALNTEQE